jgi:hypothetical protein
MHSILDLLHAIIAADAVDAMTRLRAAFLMARLGSL